MVGEEKRMDPILLIAPVLAKSGPFSLFSSLVTALPTFPSHFVRSGAGASTRQSACHASSARDPRYVEISANWIESFRRGGRAEPVFCSHVGRQRRSRTMVLNPSFRKWLTRRSTTMTANVSGLTVHTMQFRVHLRGVDRGKGVEILPFVVKEFDVFTQISLSLLRLKLVGFKAALFCSKVKRFLFFSKFL